MSRWKMCCLGFIVGDRLMIFVEAQSTWSDNIVIRSLLYMSQTIQEYIMQSDQYIYGTKRVSFPKPELYVLYTGARKTRPNKLRLSEVFFGGEPCDIDVTVHMLYDGKEGDIINQYVTFLKVCFAQFKIYGRNQKRTLKASLRIQPVPFKVSACPLSRLPPPSIAASIRSDSGSILLLWTPSLKHDINN